MVEDRRNDRVTQRRNGGGDPDGFRRIEVITGVGRRRQWSEADKAAIVAESLEPGVGVSVVARRYNVCPSLVYSWRRRYRWETTDGATSEPATALPAPAFVPVVIGSEPKPSPRDADGVIEVVVGGVTVRVSGAVDGAALGQVLAVVRRLS